MSKITITNPAAVTNQVCGLRLDPGANEVDADVWEKIQCDHVRELVKRGLLRVRMPPKADQVFEPETAGFPEIARLKPADALKAVAACESVPQLEAWFQEDGRKSVKDAIVRRRYALEPKASADPVEAAGAAADDDVKVF